MRSFGQQNVLKTNRQRRLERRRHQTDLAPMPLESVATSWQIVEAEYSKLLKEVSRRDPNSLTGLDGLDEYFQQCPEAAQSCYIELNKTLQSPRRDCRSSQSSDGSDEI